MSIFFSCAFILIRWLVRIWNVSEIVLLILIREQIMPSKFIELKNEKVYYASVAAAYISK